MSQRITQKLILAELDTLIKTGYEIYHDSSKMTGDKLSRAFRALDLKEDKKKWFARCCKSIKKIFKSETSVIRFKNLILKSGGVFEDEGMRRAVDLLSEFHAQIKNTHTENRVDNKKALNYKDGVFYYGKHLCCVQSNHRIICDALFSKSDTYSVQTLDLEEKIYRNGESNEESLRKIVSRLNSKIKKALKIKKSVIQVRAGSVIRLI